MSDRISQQVANWTESCRILQFSWMLACPQAERQLWAQPLEMRFSWVGFWWHLWPIFCPHHQLQAVCLEKLSEALHIVAGSERELYELRHFDLQESSPSHNQADPPYTALIQKPGTPIAQEPAELKDFHCTACAYLPQSQASLDISRHGCLRCWEGLSSKGDCKHCILSCKDC